MKKRSDKKSLAQLREVFRYVKGMGSVNVQYGRKKATTASRRKRKNR